jgi:hypothetical protein
VRALTPADRRRRARKVAVRALAQRLHGEAQATRAAIDDALRQVGGRITADVVLRDGAWHIAGEFDDIPRHLLRRANAFSLARAACSNRIAGNVDQVADMAGMSEGDLLEYLAEHPTKPKFADALAEAELCYDRTMSSTADEDTLERWRSKRSIARDRARAEGRCIICLKNECAPNATCADCGKRANEARKRRRDAA